MGPEAFIEVSRLIHGGFAHSQMHGYFQTTFRSRFVLITLKRV